MRAIDLKDITFTYAGSSERALDGVDFFMEYGELALLSGLSGSGKSTLMNIICGIIPNIVKGKLGGQVNIDGQDIQQMTMSGICRKIGVVLQNADEQIIHNKVEDEIAFGCENLAFPPDEIEKSIIKACENMHLDRNMPTRTLSGGQKQRFITASVLAMRQKIIVLDEPLANLDTQGALILLSALKNLAKSGYAILLIEHRLDMVMQFVDRVWHIEKGILYKVVDKDKYLMSRANKIDDIVGDYKDKGNIFELRGIEYKVKDKQILKGIDLEIKRGSRTLLLGQNGCGKTTLVRVLSRLIKPTKGEAVQNIDKKLSGRGNKKWFKNVGVVYQNPNYQLFMPTVEKELCFGTKDKTYAMYMAERFGITHLLKRHPQSLSEGQKRLVTVASVLASNPKVLILDEPTVGQDYDNLKKMTDIINELHISTDNTILTITHDIRCADALCDKAVVIADGKVQKYGDKQVAKEFFDNQLKIRI